MTCFWLSATAGIKQMKDAFDTSDGFSAVRKDGSRYTTVKYWDEEPSATSLVPWMDSSMQLDLCTIEQHGEAFVYHVEGGSMYAAACSDCKVVKVYSGMSRVVPSFCMMLQ